MKVFRLVGLIIVLFVLAYASYDIDTDLVVTGTGTFTSNVYVHNALDTNDHFLYFKDNADETNDTCRIDFGLTPSDIEALYWNPFATRFEFSNQLFVRGQIEGEGVIRATTNLQTKTDLQLNLDSTASNVQIQFGRVGTDATLIWNETNDNFVFSDPVISPTVLSKSWSLENPAVGDSLGAAIISSSHPITVLTIRVVLLGSATPSVSFNIPHGLNRDMSSGGANLFSSAQTITSTTTGSTLITFNDASLVADEWIFPVIIAQSGTVKSIDIIMEYKIDQ